MLALVAVDGSQSSRDALQYAAQCWPRAHLLLLHVAPSGREGDLARGRFLLEAGRRDLEECAEPLHVETRLEIGNLQEVLNQVADQAACDMVVLGAHGIEGLHHVDPVSAASAEVAAHLRRPVVVVLSDGRALGPGEEVSGGDNLTRGVAARFARRRAGMAA